MKKFQIAILAVPILLFSCKKNDDNNSTAAEYGSVRFTNTSPSQGYIIYEGSNAVDNNLPPNSSHLFDNVTAGTHRYRAQPAGIVANGPETDLVVVKGNTIEWTIQ